MFGLALLAGVALAADQQYQVSVTSNLTAIVPPAQMEQAPAWVSGQTNAAGAYVQVSGGPIYMCLVSPGTASTNAPAGNAVLLADGYRWAQAGKGARLGLVVSAVSGTNDLYVSGIALQSPYGSFTASGAECPQGTILAKTAQGTNTVAVWIWGAR